MFKKVFLMLGLLALFMLAPVLVNFTLGNEIKYNTTSISAYNPYRMDVKIEVKCDWDWKINRFTFHKFFIIPGKGNVVIVVPNSMKKCECWPKILW